MEEMRNGDGKFCENINIKLEKLCVGSSQNND
jgi:hypothetical protein